MNFNVVSAIFRRNFISYFSSLTGYVFLCVFVVLIAIAAFCQAEFFSANLANLDQLNKHLPLIMLVFIPAVTMGIWADERRQGTDELLLTIPAADFDVVLGKYLAAVAIFTVSLLFSALANWLVFVYTLGMPDIGLFLATYFGYWLVGLAMVAIGMCASFLTGNLTVSFILGVIFNAPLVFLSAVESFKVPGPLHLNLLGDVIVNPKSWSLAEQFRDLGQGVISLSSIGYFLLIVVVMLYFCMLLIGRRHWLGGKDGSSMLGHYLARGAALILIAIGLNLLFERISALNRARFDITAAQLSTLSPKTRELLASVSKDSPYPVQVEAYISPVVPEAYAQTRVNLINALREIDAAGDQKIRVQIHSTEPLSDQAANADEQFEIKGRQVPSRVQGALKLEQIFMGFAVTSGLEKVVVPFVDKGVPAEYELIRSICTVAKKDRKKVGVLSTDARMFGGFDQSTMGMSRNQMIIDELEKQYEVKEVRADSPITEKFDVLLAVQPSSLSPEAMTNFLAAVKSGQPTAIFEDPFPFLDSNVPGTGAPRQAPGGNNPMAMMMGGRQPPPPKGDIRPLWKLLGVDFRDQEVIYQNWNPYPAFGTLPNEFVFVGKGSGAVQPFNEKESATSGLNQMLFVFPGGVRRLQASDLSFTPLVYTGNETGTVNANDILQPQTFMGGGGLNPNRKPTPTNEEYILACHIQGKLRDDLQMFAQEPIEKPAEDKPTNSTKSEDAAKPADSKADKSSEINVIVVPDIDILYSAFFQLREQGEQEGAQANLNLDNVTFVLNCLDILAGDDSFVDIRKRHPKHRTLELFEQSTAQARDDATHERDQFTKEFEEAKSKEEANLNEEVRKIRDDKSMDINEKQQLAEIKLQAGQKRLTATIERLERERDKKIEKIERSYANLERRKQNLVRTLAVVCPPVLPLFVGLVVYFNRRTKEREGVSKNRLR